jgi:hypothetical protein
VNEKHRRACEEVRRRFEGREAIYIEHGIMRVRVSDIRALAGFSLRARIEEIPTPGFRSGMFHSVPRDHEMRWTIGAGCSSTFSEHSWKSGYGGWSMYFGWDAVRAAVNRAAQLPANVDPMEAYREVWKRLAELRLDREPTQCVFADVVDRGTGRSLPSDEPPVSVGSRKGWATCPWCGMRFKVSDAMRWDGEKHTRCGQRLFITSEEGPLSGDDPW